MASVSIPGITILFMGFVGYGVTAVIEIGCFVVRALRLRWWAVPISLFVFWLLLSFYVTYMVGRERIRESVWKGASLGDRLVAMGESF